MKEGGQISMMNVPMIDFGFLTMSRDKQELYNHALNQNKGEARKSLDVISFDAQGNTKGLNSFIPILINQENLLPENEFLLSLSQFGQAFNTKPNFFRNTYQDPAIILRTNGDQVKRNDYLAKNLFNKLEKRGFTATPEKPIVISLTDFKRPRQNNNSGYGLVYDLTENAKPIIAPEYGTKETVTKFNIYDERGVPIPDKNGKYTIWKRNAGVSRMFSSCVQGAISYDDRLAISYAYGKVVVGRNAVPQSHAQIEKIITQEEKRRKTVRKDLEARIAKLK